MWKIINVILLTLAVGSHVQGIPLLPNMCSRSGFFPLVDNTPEYYECSYIPGFGYQIRYLICANGLVFSSNYGECVSPTVAVGANQRTVRAGSSDIESPTVPTVPTTKASPKPDSDDDSTTPTTSTSETQSTDSTTTSTEGPITDSTTTSTEGSTTDSTTTSTEGPITDSTTTSTDSTTTSTEGPITDSTTTSTEGPITDSTTTSTEAPITDSTTTSTEGPITDSTTTSTQGPITDTTTTSTEGPITDTTTTSDAPNTETTDADTETVETSTPTEPTTTTTDGGVDPFDCRGAGFFPELNSCSTYIYCFNLDNKWQGKRFHCPEGMNFNLQNFCDANYECSEGAAEKLITLQYEFECEVEGTFAYPGDCKKYYQCWWDTRVNSFAFVAKSCPQNEVYNNSTGQCGKATDTTCQGR